MKKLKYGLLLSSIILAGCGGDNNTTSSTQQSYDITITNLTNNQPLSPTAMAIHDTTYMPWHTGAAASAGLEMIAESGDTTDWLTEASAAFTTGTTTGVLLPGASTSSTLTLSGPGSYSLTTASMLVNTNDAFTGISNESLSDLAVGDSLTVIARAYDAGTETNSESAATIPGPAANGEGFNSARETLDRITVHSGVVTSGDGLSSSALDESHRFDQGVQFIKVTRTL